MLSSQTLAQVPSTRRRRPALEATLLRSLRQTAGKPLARSQGCGHLTEKPSLRVEGVEVAG